MQLRKKMVLIVIASILLTAVPGAALIYRFVERNILVSASSKLEETTGALAQLAMQRFAQGEPKLSALARLVQQELAQPIRPDELAAFHETMERNLDGAWRNRKPGYDGKHEAGIFLPPDAELSDLQKIRHLRIKQVMDTFGAAASKPLENVWYLSSQRSEIIFDRALPEFVFDMKADTDYTQTPWLTYTSPQLNSGREFRFTPPLYDPVAKLWMVSAVYPLYINGQWIGSVGEDMPLTGAMRPLFGQITIYPGVQHFLLDRQGHFVLAGPWQEQLESTPGTYRPDLSQEPQLAALLNSPLSDSPNLLTDEIVVRGKRYMAIGMQLQPLGWSYYRLAPLDGIIAPARQLFLGIVAMLLAVTILAGMMIGTAVGSSITRRIRLLSEVMKGYVSDHHLRAPVQLNGDDEIADAARVFNEMAADIDRNLAHRQQTEAALSKSEELWRFALEGSGDGVWDWNVAERTIVLTKRWKEIIGFTEDELEDGLVEWELRVHPEDKTATDAALQDCLDGRTPVYVKEVRLRCKDDSYKWVLDRGMVVSRCSDGKPLRMIGTHHDITERKQAEQALQSSLRDKEALLSEVHHRVKNNLQVVTSLLRLEAGRNAHPQTRSVLGDMQGRIHSMALLHESLYRSGTFASIDLGGYLRQLSSQSFRALAVAPGAIQLQLDLASVQVEMDQALPCGLLVNELLSNCLKHGFPDGRSGEVRVELHALDAGRQLRLRVSDTGVGLPEDFESRRSHSLGLQLVSDLAGQLQGTLEIGPGPAAEFTITFSAAEIRLSALPA